MKKIILITVIASLSQWALRAQPLTANKEQTGFEKAMLNGIRQLDTASVASFVSLGNSFERIGNVEKTRWHPFYYAAYCYVSIAFVSPDKNAIDGLADKAESLLKQAEELDPTNSEISCLFAMINSCRIMVDPVSRFQSRGKDVQIFLGKAKREDINNPRIYLLEAMMQMRTPEAFGGGPKVARPTTEKAIEKFKSFVPKDLLYPAWGNHQALALLNKIGVNNQ